MAVRKHFGWVLVAGVGVARTLAWLVSSRRWR